MGILNQIMPETPTLTVAAASSLAPILPQIIAAWSKESKTVIRPNFGASGTLLRQIAAGAPIDLFLSAGDNEVDELIDRDAVRKETRLVFAQNRLVLAQAKSARILLRSWTDLRTLPAGFRIALGKPDTVPAGRYAKATLQKRGLYERLQAERRLIFTGTVRQAADAAATGNADAALIFATDVRADTRLRTVATAVPGTDHVPIHYVAIVTQQTRSAAAAVSFVHFLHASVTQRILKSAGFVNG